MKVFLMILVMFVFLSDTLNGQSKTFQILFYNTENLFDTIDDPLKMDEEFTPGSRKQWNTQKYLKKVTMVSEALSIGTIGYPSIIGLCEVENRRVLNDLVVSKALKEANYHIIHEEGRDIRGIDVALLYNPDDFNYLYHQALKIDMPFDPDYKTRDILYVKGEMDGETVHLYINHWPSRRGGMEKSEPRRVTAAHVLKRHLDSISHSDSVVNIIIMGDLNDEPYNSSVMEVLGAKPYCDTCLSDSLFSLVNMTTTIPEGEGTYFYWRTQKWNSLDHIIVSSFLLHPHNELSVEEKTMKVVNNPKLMKVNNYETLVPFSTFAKEYEGGYSDHLPVIITIKR